MFNALANWHKVGTDHASASSDMCNITGRHKGQNVLKNLLLQIGVALALLTRLPLPQLPENAFAKQGHSAWAWPIAGLTVAALALLPGLAALALGLPAGIAALLILATQMVLTGAMHEDGLADTVDGLWGGWTPERRLEIMKDSHIGTYGVLALVLSTGLRWTLLSALIPYGAGPVLACAALSRAPMPALMSLLPNARANGLSHKVGAPPTVAILGAAAMALSIALSAVGWPALPAALALVPSTALLGRIAWAKIGGQTGDILGASQQLSEITAALILLAILSA